MAKGLKYKIPFVSLTEISYEIQIFVEGWSGTATQLVGGESPFSTEESGDDWLEPVALQTGYMRIVCEESTWRDLVPNSSTSHYVKLVESESTIPVWQGYIQQSTYTHSLYCGYDEYEFPICSALSLLNDKYPTWSAGRITFAAIIADILAMCGGDVIWETIYFPNNLQGTVSKDLASEISLTPFSELKERIVHSELYSYMEDYYDITFTYMEILTKICQFWGWTLHENGTSLYFSAHDENVGWRQVALVSLPGVDSNVVLPTVPESTRNYSSLRWMSDNHEVNLETPINKITFKGNVSDEETIINFDIAKVAQFADFPYRTSVYNNTYYAECASKNSYTNFNNGGVETTFVGASGNNPSRIQELLSWGADYAYGPVFRKYDQWPVASDSGKTKYNWTQEIFMGLFTDGTTSGDSYAVLTIKSLDSYVLSDCAIAVSANVKCTANMVATTNFLEIMAVVGNYHWDGSQWVENSGSWRGTWVHAYVGDDENRSQQTTSGQIVTTLNYTTQYQGAEGYGMPVTTPIKGRVAIYFRWLQREQPISGATYSCYSLTNLKVKIVPIARSTTGVTPQKENIYTATNDGFGEEELELTFMTKNNNLASDKLISLENAWLETMGWQDGTTSRPEEHLMTRTMRLKGGCGTEWREIDIDNRGATSIAPYVESGTRLYPIRVSREWREGSAKVKLGKNV